MNSYLKIIRTVVVVLIIVGVLAAAAKVGYMYATRRYSDRVAELSVQLSKTTETVELTTGLYTKQLIKYDNLVKLFASVDNAEIKALKKQLDESKAKLLVAEQVSLRWKKAYEDALAATQTEEPAGDTGVPRKRVDFDGKLGPIHASGHTLTDPPEAFLRLEQTDPLVLTMSVAQNRDKTWVTYVTSSDPNVDVKVDLAAVNPLILKEPWYERIWIDAGATFLGDAAGRVGVRYQFDRLSLGGDCTVWQTGSGCGLSVGYRIFK